MAICSSQQGRNSQSGRGCIVDENAMEIEENEERRWWSVDASGCYRHMTELDISRDTLFPSGIGPSGSWFLLERQLRPKSVFIGCSTLVR